MSIKHEAHHTQANFLTADTQGFALYKGDTIYSIYHQKFVTLTGVYVDCDGDVYVYFDGGNLRVSSVQRVDDFKELEAAANRHIEFIKMQGASA